MPWISNRDSVLTLKSLKSLGDRANNHEKFTVQNRFRLKSYIVDTSPQLRLPYD